MKKITLTDEENAIVAAAHKLDCLHETCIWEDYHPDYGRVEEYWKPKCFVSDLMWEMSRYYKSKK